MIGSAVGAGLAGFLAVEIHVMWGGPIVGVVGAVGQPLAFVLALIVGSATTAGIALGLIAATERHRARKAARGTDVVTAGADPLPSSPRSPIDVAPSGGGGAVATKVRPATVLDYISEDTILLDSTARDRDAMISELVALGVKTGQIADPAVVLTSALAREALMSTAVGEGIAIPHAKSEGAASPMVAFAKAKGIDWGSPSGDLARLVFLISVPEADAGDEHLRILAKLSRALARPAVRDALDHAATKTEVLEVLKSAVD